MSAVTAYAWQWVLLAAASLTLLWGAALYFRDGRRAS